jgi:hypothetical protein
VKTRLIFLIFVFIFLKYNAQQYVFGKISDDSAVELNGVMVMNMRTESTTFSDGIGNYMIAALPTDEIRFIRLNFQRTSVKLSAENFTKPLDIVMQHDLILIPEVEIGFHPTGNLKKDSKMLDISPKIASLNSEMNAYMRMKPTEVLPKNTIPSAFSRPDITAGTVDFIGLLGAAVGLTKKAVEPKITQATYAETQAFYRNIKQNIDLTYYRDHGLDEYQLEEFLIYADKKYELAKNYRKKFNKEEINGYLRMAFVEYLKGHPVKEPS